MSDVGAEHGRMTRVCAKHQFHTQEHMDSRFRVNDGVGGDDRWGGTGTIPVEPGQGSELSDTG